MTKLVKTVYYYSMKQLQSLAQGLWTISHPFAAGGVHFGTRTTVVAVREGLVLISPGPLNDEAVGELAEIGEVVGLIAPNLMHHLFLERAQSLYPQARTWIAPGLDAKRPELLYDEVLQAKLADLWSGEMEQIQVGGMPKLNETVFFHNSSQTLILTDLAFNFRSCEHPPTRWMLRLNNAWKRFGPTRLLRYFFLRDQKEFAVDLAGILQWPFERVIVAHGEVLESGGRDALREGYSWIR